MIKERLPRMSALIHMPCGPLNLLPLFFQDLEGNTSVKSHLGSTFSSQFLSTTRAISWPRLPVALSLNLLLCSLFFPLLLPQAGWGFHKGTGVTLGSFSPPGVCPALGSVLSLAGPLPPPRTFQILSSHCNRRPALPLPSLSPQMSRYRLYLF